MYRATDTKLGRSVAVKVLPEMFELETDRVARFEREAKVLASLNHPHIAALYGMEEAGGRHFLVMELVEGQTLAERIAATGGRGLGVTAALEIARQIAEALEAAHEKGIVHRDLKPANVKITPDDQVKVLDFGLAKALETAPAAGNVTQSPTFSMAATQAGMIRKRVSFSRDFAGRQPDPLYRQPTSAHPIDVRSRAAIDRRDRESLNRGRAGVFARRCIHRVLGGRPDAQADGDSGRGSGAQPLKLSPGPYEPPRVAPDGARVAFGTDDGKEAIVWVYDFAGTSSMRRLTFGGNNRFPVWSPKGDRLAFQSDREKDVAVFSQTADGTVAAERLTKPEPGTSHRPESWSPDGKTLLFNTITGTTSSLWMLSLPEGKVAPFGSVDSPDPLNATFSPDGRWVAYGKTEQGGASWVYVEPFPPTGAKYQMKHLGAHHPVWSPDGRELFYIPAPGQFVAVSVATKPFFSFGNPVPVPRRFSQGNAPNNVRSYDITPDGKQFIGMVVAGEIQAGVASVNQIQVVINWFEELKQRVAGK